MDSETGLINKRKEETLKEIADWKKANTVDEKLNLIAKKLGLI